MWPFKTKPAPVTYIRDPIPEVRTEFDIERFDVVSIERNGPVTIIGVFWKPEDKEPSEWNFLATNAEHAAFVHRFRAKISARNQPPCSPPSSPS